MESPPDISADEAAKRFALFSVYQYSLGRQFEVRGAPSVLLPPDSRPQILEAALDTLKDDAVRFRAAVWLILRGIPVHPDKVDDLSGYPPALFTTRLSREDICSLRRTQLALRQGSYLFAAALAACRDGRTQEGQEFGQLLGMLDQLEPAKDGSLAEDANFSNVTENIMSLSAAQFARSWFGNDPDRARHEVQRLESEIGISLYDFVDQLTSAVAFESFTETLPAVFGSRQDGDIVIYPVTTLVRQDTETLVTTATVTTLAKADFEDLCRVSEPANWQESSQVIWTSRYVTKPFDFTESAVRPELLEPPTQDLGRPGRSRSSDWLLLQERARLAWDRGWNNQTQFENILYVRGTRGLADRPDYKSFDVDYALCRSIDSRMLWDCQEGGLELDEGYLKVRPLGADITNTWRTTTRKVIRFSDRTPASGGRGWMDFGEVLNYFAPAAITWWLETETYSISRKAGKGDPKIAPPSTDGGAHD